MTNRNTLALALAAGGLCVQMLLASGAAAQSIKQKDMIAHDKEKAASLAKEANDACGTQVKFSIDYASYSKVLDDDNNQSPWAYLANVTDAFKTVCRTDAGKQGIQQKIKSVSVANGETEIESLSNGAFRYQVPYRGHSPATVVKWLQSNL